MQIDFWVDPICPWCWVTARWVVDEVAPRRNLDITWQPISLYLKNEPDTDSQYHDAVLFTHSLLRVMESVRVDVGNEGVFKLYWELGRRIHHDQNRDFTAADALAAVGLDTSHAEAFEDAKWDSTIRERMDEGLALAGNDIGTPLIGFENGVGKRVAYFGPVITRVPPTDDSLALWDGLIRLATVEGFWELKRTRNDRPEFGERP